MVNFSPGISWIVILQRADIVTSLRSDILRMQGLQHLGKSIVDLGLDRVCDAFPNGTFPLGAIHEFLSIDPESRASTNGFLSGILSHLMADAGVTLWISRNRSIFPPALKSFGVQPDRVVFVDLSREKDILWVMDEALRCGALTAVVGELSEISFTESRRLQLAVEQSHVTGFILRSHRHKLTTTASVSRWKITPLPSALKDDLPGVGFPQWRVELLRMRNGRPGAWDIRWANGRFSIINQPQSIIVESKKAG